MKGSGLGAVECNDGTGPGRKEEIHEALAQQSVLKTETSNMSNNSASQFPYRTAIPEKSV
jgi:hypothetical protein